MIGCIVGTLVGSARAEIDRDGMLHSQYSFSMVSLYSNIYSDDNLLWFVFVLVFETYVPL